jgi:GNAT superfamily N-acetyltransferase
VTRASIRRALVSEQKELEVLQLRASLTNAGDRAALLAHADAIEVPLEQIRAGTVNVWEQDGVILGFAAWVPATDGTAELDALFVDPDARGCGIGRSLVEHCVGDARAHGAAALSVVGNPHAFDFYSRCRFELLGTTETRFGPGLRMRKLI